MTACTSYPPVSMSPDLPPLPTPLHAPCSPTYRIPTANMTWSYVNSYIVAIQVDLSAECATVLDFLEVQLCGKSASSSPTAFATSTCQTSVVSTVNSGGNARIHAGFPRYPGPPYWNNATRNAWPVDAAGATLYRFKAYLVFPPSYYATAGWRWAPAYVVATGECVRTQMASFDGIIGAAGSVTSYPVPTPNATLLPAPINATLQADLQTITWIVPSHARIATVTSYAIHFPSVNMDPEIVSLEGRVLVPGSLVTYTLAVPVPTFMRYRDGASTHLGAFWAWLALVDPIGGGLGVPTYPSATNTTFPPVFTPATIGPKLVSMNTIGSSDTNVPGLYVGKPFEWGLVESQVTSE